MSLPRIHIRKSGPSDAPAVAAFCQPIFAAVYPNAQAGLKPEHFAPDIFQTTDTLAYFAKTLTNSSDQLALIAESADGIIGTISIERLDGYYEVHSFYVEPKLQGQGIGRKLLDAALEFVTDNQPVRVEVAISNAKAIATYRHFGFIDAPELGRKFRHWPEWPEGIRNEYLFLRLYKEDYR